MSRFAMVIALSLFLLLYSVTVMGQMEAGMAGEMAYGILNTVYALNTDRVRKIKPYFDWGRHHAVTNGLNVLKSSTQPTTTETRTTTAPVSTTRTTSSASTTHTATLESVVRSTTNLFPLTSPAPLSTSTTSAPVIPTKWTHKHRTHRPRGPKNTKGLKTGNLKKNKRIRVDEEEDKSPKETTEAIQTTTELSHEDLDKDVTLGEETTSQGSVTNDPICNGEGEWSEWGDMGKCSEECGACGVVQRFRKCLSFKNGTGCPCSGNYKTVRPCNVQTCKFPKPSCCPPYDLMYKHEKFWCGPQEEDVLNDALKEIK
ncbi:unnamed protein product [Bursaphelenchus xylophilus]|uniref:(pine wood nematode) hypothetical protein n=1 Tax=Bursaphelenchus xylophilus TaxID=6326 RepID=A0A1I7S906_BURXY|nr:unnamed protein product [Bursaphelenchus xylophilus]CAG9086100.1 unnamed protein product [Bursaphelenchus xylophilus]